MAFTSIDDILIDNQDVDKADLRAYLKDRETCSDVPIAGKSAQDIAALYTEEGSFRGYNGGGEAITAAGGDTPIINVDAETDTNIRNVIFEGLGKGVGTAPLIEFSGEYNAARFGLENIWLRNGHTGIKLSAGWGHFLDRLRVTQMTVGIDHEESPIQSGWSGSGYVNMNAYVAGCDIGIRDTALWNATYINPVIEDCTDPYIQSTQGTATVMINPWLEDNTNPPQFRRGSVILGGRFQNVEEMFGDVQLPSVRLQDAITWIHRDGVWVFRDKDNIHFRARGHGVDRFTGNLTAIGFSAYHDSETTSKGLQILDQSGMAERWGVFGVRGAGDNDAANNVGLALSNFSGYFGSSVQAAMAANAPNSQIRFTAARSSANGGSAIGAIQFLTTTTTQNGGNAEALVGRVEIYEAALRPMADNATALGGSSNRWTTVYAATGTINTSDETQKANLRSIDDDLIEAFLAIEPQLYQWNDAVEAKGGDLARWHMGFVAQHLEAALRARGVDPERYAIWCRDPVIERVEDGTIQNADWYEGSDLPKEVPAFTERQKLDANGEPVWTYGLRYDQFIALMEAANRRRFAAIEARLAALEGAV